MKRLMWLYEKYQAAIYFGLFWFFAHLADFIGTILTVDWHIENDGLPKWNVQIKRVK